MIGWWIIRCLIMSMANLLWAAEVSVLDAELEFQVA
jgi:hypothetical protein